MNKHAYLIMAHNNFYCLEKLLLLLDDERNDIFLHIDAKVKKFDFAKFQALCQRARVIYPRKRINVKWGTQSQVRTEILLFKTAAACGPYHYYHLISGVDLPLKTQDEIHAFFADKKSSYLFYKEQTSQWDYCRVSRYNILVGKYGTTAKKIKDYWSLIQNKLAVDRARKHSMEIKKGANWGSFNQEAVNILLYSVKSIMKLTRFSLCADEVYKQTILLHKGYQIENDDLRRIEWHGGNHPKVYKAEDFTQLTQSDKLYARKFDERVDQQIIDMIYEYVRQKEGQS